MHYSLGEHGFEPMRFGGRMPAPDHCELAHLIPVVMKIPNKTNRGLADVNRAQLAMMMNICAGMEVKTVFSSQLSASIRIDISNRFVEFSQDCTSGLRDAIFAGVLMREYHEDAILAALGMDAVLEEAQLRIVEEVPQVLTYAGSSTLRLSMLDDGRFVLQTNRHCGGCALPFEVAEHVVQRRDIILMSAA